jgi:hypothetical protein
MRPHLTVVLACTLVAGCSCSDENGVAPPDAGSPDAKIVDAAATKDSKPDGPPAKPDASDSWTCPTYKPPAQAGTVGAPEINETSGLAVSSKNSGVLWLHNDSGDAPRVFAIDTSAKLLGTYTLGGAKAVDWEDMTVGPGPAAGESYLYLGDIGDNPSLRPDIAVYRVKEPTVTPGQSPVTITLSGVETLPFVYPDGAHNAETLLADRKSGDLYIVIKTDAAAAGIYRSKAPQTPGKKRTLTKEGDVKLGTLITGGDVSHDGTEVLIRTYNEAWLWHWPAGSTLAAALAAAPCKVPAAAEPQGEAIAFSPATKDYYTLSEKTSQPLYLYQRD